MKPFIYKDLLIHFVYQQLSPTEAENIKQFWLNRGAISDLNIIKDRLQQVVLVVKNKENKIIGISSVYSNLLQDKPYFFYRMFIDPDYRNTRLMAVMTMQTWLCLSQKKNLSPIGMAIVTENPKLQRSGFRKYFKRVLGFQYLGQNEIQQDIWFLDFNQNPIYFKKQKRYKHPSYLICFYGQQNIKNIEAYFFNKNYQIYFLDLSNKKLFNPSDPDFVLKVIPLLLDMGMIILASFKTPLDQKIRQLIDPKNLIEFDLKEEKQLIQEIEQILKPKK